MRLANGTFYAFLDMLILIFAFPIRVINFLHKRTKNLLWMMYVIPKFQADPTSFGVSLMDLPLYFGKFLSKLIP
jgi:hypothetical protein